jgi:LmbE family N-acetylglucosaminyl deacetylase
MGRCVPPLLIAWLVAAFGAASPSLASIPESSPLTIGPAERLLVVAPHPDDETLGAGGLVQRVLALGGTVAVVWITAGDGYVEAVEQETGEPRPRAAEFVAYGKRRIGEARAAVRVLAHGSSGDRLRLVELGFPDSGLARLLLGHWDRMHPERSATTGASRPPYPEAADRGVEYDGSDLRRELVKLLKATRPTLIAFPDPLDWHPDHHATGLFALLAIKDWRARGRERSTLVPRLLAYLVHWPGWPPGWDTDPARQPIDAPLTLPRDLPGRGLERVVLELTHDEVLRKQAALAAHRTQEQVMAPFLRSFVRRTEPFSLLTPRELRRVAGVIDRRAR